MTHSGLILSLFGSSVVALLASSSLFAAETGNAAKVAEIQKYCAQAGGASALVKPGPDGKLVYQSDEFGNRVVDFSHAGYMGGGVAIPNVRTALEIAPSGADDTAALQAAIDKLSALPLGPDGFRGALALKRGKFIVTNTLFIRAGGIVIRGAGAGFGGTWIYHLPQIPAGGAKAEPEPENGGMVHFPQPGRGIVPTFETVTTQSYQQLLELDKVTEIDEAAVPAGAMSLRVKSTDGLEPGMKIAVISRQTADWIAALGLSGVWKKTDDFALRMERVVVSVDSATRLITLDQPVNTRIDIARGFAVGEIARIRADHRLAQVGIEDLLFLSGYDRSKIDKKGYFNDELHPNLAARFYNVRDGWLRRCTALNYSYAFVRMRGSRHVTVEDVGMLDGVSRDTPINHAGARKYYFDNGEDSLVQRCYARYARHAFTGNGPTGGSVFLDCYSEKDHLPAEWHQRWGYGHLFDNLCTEASIQAKGVAGDIGHGQTAAFAMVWNCLILNRRTYEADLVITMRGNLCTNYAVGNILGGSGQARSELNLKKEESLARGWIESTNRMVTPRSLYLKQLADRLGTTAVNNVATPLQQQGAPGTVWLDLIHRFGVLPEYCDPALAPWPGLENWVPQFASAPTASK